MKISAIFFAHLTVPLNTPFKTALREVDAIQDLVVIIETDNGHRGYGSAPSTPVITGDTHSSVRAAIEQVFAPRLVGQDIEQFSNLLTIVQGAMPHNTSAKAALEIALYDLWGQYLKQPLYKLLGGGTPRLRTDITISVDTIDKMVLDCEHALARGFDVLKIKIGKQIHDDIERIRAICHSVGQRARIRLDVNQGWNAKQTVFALTQLEREGVELELVEQPVKGNDIQGLEYICQRVNTPVMADESAFSLQQVEQLIRLRAADIINIKLMKTGGLSQALLIADYAAQHDVPCMIGCMLEGGIGVTAAAHLAVARSGSIPLVDLDGPVLGKFDPVQGGANFNDADISLDDGHGLGIRAIDGLIIA